MIMGIGEKSVRQFSNSEFLPEVVRLLDAGHTVTIRLRGYSMRPFLEDNRDKAVLKKADMPMSGMPVLAEIGHRHYVLHRIVSIKCDAVVLRGDGNIGTETCRLSDVKAEVVGFYRKGRDRMDMVDGLKWRMYSVFWTKLTPLFVRRYILAVYRRLVKTEKINRDA